MKRLDDENLRARYDRQGMIQVIDQFSVQCSEAIEQGERFEIPSLGPIDKVIVCGMGGSAMEGEIARRFAKVPVFVNRSYTLPAFVDSHTLLAAISYSKGQGQIFTFGVSGYERRLVAGEPECLREVRLKSVSTLDEKACRVEDQASPGASSGWDLEDIMTSKARLRPHAVRNNGDLVLWKKLSLCPLRHIPL